MIRHRIAVTGLAAVTLLTAGCSVFERWFGAASDPRPLVEWAESNAVSVGAPPARGASDKSIVSVNAHNGYEIKSPDSAVANILYFVPLERLDPSYEATLRKAAFPGGTATVHGSGNSGSVKLAESEIDKFYVNLFVGHDASQCENFTKRCDAVFTVAIVAKLKNASLMDRAGHELMFDVFKSVDNDRLMAGHVGDAQAICGFDPNKDRVPSRIARGCDTVRMMTFAADNGFTMMRMLGLVPMTPEALRMVVAEFLAEPMYENGVAKAQMMGMK